MDRRTLIKFIGSLNIRICYTNDIVAFRKRFDTVSNSSDVDSIECSLFGGSVRLVYGIIKTNRISAEKINAIYIKYAIHTNINSRNYSNNS